MTLRRKCKVVILKIGMHSRPYELPEEWQLSKVQ
jgi:hypothetical protein